MSTYVTVVNWNTTPLTPEELVSLTNYVNAQTEGNGTVTTYQNRYARSWVDEAAAIDFCTFVETLQSNQTVPVTTIIYTIA
jgi:phosphopantothenate synthetase